MNNFSQIPDLIPDEEPAAIDCSAGTMLLDQVGYPDLVPPHLVVLGSQPVSGKRGHEVCCPS